jgi:hypothetical protein
MLEQAGSLWSTVDNAGRQLSTARYGMIPLYKQVMAAVSRTDNPHTIIDQGHLDDR